ncbi:MAG: hypothetical protein NTX28_00470, partial [Novosphingobium sp.]|nr:hypothetical protein [Novosphingobium sp.]
MAAAVDQLAVFPDIGHPQLGALPGHARVVPAQPGQLLAIRGQARGGIKVVAVDEDGFLFLSGRADDVIVRGGENLSPGEIEDVLLTHPAIVDACAVGIASVEWGETVAVAVVVRDGHDTPAEDDLRKLVRDRLRSSRVPEVIRFEQALPYNEMGKLLRREVRKFFAA